MDLSDIADKLKQAETILEEVRTEIIKARSERGSDRYDEYHGPTLKHLTPDHVLSLAEAQHKLALIVSQINILVYAYECD